MQQIPPTMLQLLSWLGPSRGHLALEGYELVLYGVPHLHGDDVLRGGTYETDHRFLPLCGVFLDTVATF